MHSDDALGLLTNAGAIDHSIAEQAAHWLARLGADDVSDRDVRECEAWRQQHSEHERAWQRALQATARLGLIPAALAKPVLLRDTEKRRAVLKTLALLIAVPPTSWFAL